MRFPNHSGDSDENVIRSYAAVTGVVAALIIAPAAFAAGPEASLVNYGPRDTDDIHWNVTLAPHAKSENAAGNETGLFAGTSPDSRLVWHFDAQHGQFVLPF